MKNQTFSLEKSRQLIAREEGGRLRPYRCTAGKLTIGYGRNLEDKGISQHEADFLFQNDLDETQRALLQALPWVSELDEVRQAVLMSMAFQLGIFGLLKFEQTLSAIQAKNFDEAARRMLQSLWAKQTPTRARRHAIMMRKGQWL